MPEIGTSGLTHELPNIFLAVEFGAWRQQQEPDIARDLESLGAMPAGLIEEDDRVHAGVGLIFNGTRKKQRYGGLSPRHVRLLRNSIQKITIES